MELRNRVRNVIPKLEEFNLDLLLINRVLEFGCWMETGDFILPENRMKRQKHMEVVEFLSKTCTELSNGHLTDSDANFIGFMNTLRVNLEVGKNDIFGHSMFVKKAIKKVIEKVIERVDAITVKSWQKLLDVPCEELVEKVWYAVVVSTVALLSRVYQYLLGDDLKGGTSACSSGSLDFRDTYVSLLLFQGSYVWIFFRDVAAKRTVYCRSKKDGSGRVKYEPRFKPHREKLPGGTTINFDRLSLGGYNSHRDAEIVCQIAGFYYMRDEGQIQLRDGSFFTIPEQEESLSGKDKAQWVAARAKEVFKNFQVKNNAILPPESNAVGAHDYIQDVVSEELITLDAHRDAADTVDSEFVLYAVGEGLEGTVTSPSSADLNFLGSLIVVGEGSQGTPASPSEAEQGALRMERPQSLHLETSDTDFLTKIKISFQQLKETRRRFEEQLEQFEAEISRLIADREQHEQHLEWEKQLEELNSKLQLEDEFVRSLLC